MFKEANITKEVLNSSLKFAELLKSYGVHPPMKISPTTGKETYAFAKNDENFVALAHHSDERVQALVSARLGAKSTLEETRTERFIAISQRGPIGGALRRMPIPLKYYAAHTGRWGGSDSVNLQNLPSRGEAANKLKRCIVAPRGHVIIDCDSSQIEARVLAWLAGQLDILRLFSMKEDVYRHMASIIFDIPRDAVTKDERFIGKTTVLGCGYGMGAAKFQAQLQNMGKYVDYDTCAHIIKKYRQANGRIAAWWNHLNHVVDEMWRRQQNMPARHFEVDCLNLLELDPFTGIRLPNGLSLNYPELDRMPGTADYVYKTRNGMTKIYGGKVAENLCQAVARCIIGEQMIEIEKRYRVALTVHDAIACVVPKEQADDACAYIEQCMSTPPKWAEGLPLACEFGMADNYGDC